MCSYWANSYPLWKSRAANIKIQSFDHFQTLYMLALARKQQDFNITEAQVCKTSFHSFIHSNDQLYFLYISVMV